MKFSDPTADIDLQLGAEQTGNAVLLCRSHQTQFPTNNAGRLLAGDLNIEHRNSVAHSVRNVICFVPTFC
jgi:hypothetical protein